MLGRDLQYPPHIWLVLENERPRLTARRLTYLLEKVLVQAFRSLTYQHSAYARTDVLVGAQGALRT